MNKRDDGARGRNSHKNRDDTPSVIRYVEPRHSMPGRPSMDTMPLLEMPKSQQVWRRVRWPVFGFSVFALLLTIGLFTRSLMVASTIEKTIQDASVLESKGTLEQTEGAEKTLHALYDKYSGEDRACAAWAWQAVLQGLIWGKPLTEEAKEVIEDLHGEVDPFAVSATAGAALLEGRNQDAAARLKGEQGNPRFAMVSAMALNAGGKQDEARAALDAAMESYPDYLPLIVAAAEIAAAANDRMEVLKLSQQLLKKSPTHLVGAMLVIRLALPEWGDPALSADQLSALQKQLSILLPRIQAAPPKPAVIGQYLIGRIALAQGKANEAAQALEKVIERKKSSEATAFLAEAVRMQGNASAALAFLDKHADINGPEVMDIRAQCLLEYHRVEQAEAVVEALRKTGALPKRLQSLSWLLAVRSGNTKAALRYLPNPVGPDDKWVALEMYFQLAEEGNHKGVEALVEAFEENWASCERVIRAWHSKALGRAVRQFDNTRLDCIEALIPRLMRHHTDVQTVLQAAETNRKESGADLIFEVDRALAVWLVEGYDAAVRILDAVAAEKPEGAPLLEQLGRAYLEMNLPEKTTELLGRSEKPELLALRIFAAEMQKKKGQARKLLDKALVAAKTDTHPAFRYFDLREKLASGKPDVVRDWVNENDIASMGRWTAELAELGARAMWALEEKTESEKFLQKTARRTLVPGGAGESLDTFMVQVEQNINRSGKYKNHALVVIRTLKEESVKDPRMSYWLAMENVNNGSERLGLRMLAEIPDLDPAYKPYYKKMFSMERLDESKTAVMKKMLPYFNP